MYNLCHVNMAGKRISQHRHIRIIQQGNSVFHVNVHVSHMTKLERIF